MKKLFCYLFALLLVEVCFLKEILLRYYQFMRFVKFGSFRQGQGIQHVREGRLHFYSVKLTPRRLYLYSSGNHVEYQPQASRAFVYIYFIVVLLENQQREIGFEIRFPCYSAYWYDEIPMKSTYTNTFNVSIKQMRGIWGNFAHLLAIALYSKSHKCHSFAISSSVYFFFCKIISYLHFIFCKYNQFYLSYLH